MTDHPENFEVAVLSMIYALVKAAKLVIENDVDHYDANNEIPYDATRERGPTTRNNRMDNLFNHIECVRNEIERMLISCKSRFGEGYDPGGHSSGREWYASTFCIDC